MFHSGFPGSGLRTKKDPPPLKLPYKLNDYLFPRTPTLYERGYWKQPKYKKRGFKNEMSLPPPVNYSSHREDGCEKSRSTFGPVWWSGGMLRYTYSNNNIMIIIL